LMLGLVGQISPAQAAKCNCNPFNVGSCNLLPPPGGNSYCKVGGCSVSGNYSGRCKHSAGGGGNPKSPTNSFSAEPRRTGAKAVRPARKARRRAR
jgi:hypothetical protein